MTFVNRWLKRVALVVLAGGLSLLFGVGYHAARERVVDEGRFPFPSVETDPSSASPSDRRTSRIPWAVAGAPIQKTLASLPDIALLSEHPETEFKWDPAVPGLARVTLGDISGRTRRVALAGKVGSIFEWKGVLPPGAWFQCQIGMVTRNQGVRFSVDLEANDSEGPQRLLSETLAASPHRPTQKKQWIPTWGRGLLREREHLDGQWKPLRVDLSTWGGRSVRIWVNTVGLDPVETQGDGLALWGSPEIRFPELASAARGRKGPLALPIFLAAFESTPDDQMSLRSGRSRLSDFLGESVSFPFFYTTDVRSHKALENAVFLSSAPWPDVLGRHGYRTRAVGAFSDEMMDVLDRAGFEEIHRVSNDGFNTLRAAAQAVAWVKESSSASEVVFLYFADMPRGWWPPVRFWVHRAPLGSLAVARWKRGSEDAYRDDYFGRVVETVNRKEEDWIMGAFSLRGRATGSTPIISEKSGRSGSTYVNDPGGGMREPEIRVFFGLRSLDRWAPGLCRSPGQISDLGPTLLGALQIPFPGGGRGRVWALDRAVSLSDSSGAWGVRSAAAKALVLDGRYKYIRHLSARTWAIPSMRRTDFPAEEVFDLWNDPGEREDLAQKRRGLLARLRDVLDELDPDPAEVRLSFLNPTGQRVDGMINCVQGEMGTVVSSVGGRRMGAYEFVFSTNAAAGDIRFRPWPPLVPFRLRVLVNGKTLDPSRIQVGRWGIPLFEIKGDEWFDKTKFGWMDGWAPPRPSTETVVSLGRWAPAGEEGVTP